MRFPNAVGAGFCVGLLFCLISGCSESESQKPVLKRSSPTSKGSPAPTRALAGAEVPPETSAPPATSQTAPSAVELTARGRSVYMGNCTACHNADPTQDGSLGPAIAGASVDLLEARVIRGAYPEGYKPKKDTQLMIAMPYLKAEIGALEAYLANP